MNHDYAKSQNTKNLKVTFSGIGTQILTLCQNERSKIEILNRLFYYHNMNRLQC